MLHRDISQRIFIMNLFYSTKQFTIMNLWLSFITHKYEKVCFGWTTYLLTLNQTLRHYIYIWENLLRINDSLHRISFSLITHTYERVCFRFDGNRNLLLQTRHYFKAADYCHAAEKHRWVDSVATLNYSPTLMLISNIHARSSQFLLCENAYRFFALSAEAFPALHTGDLELIAIIDETIWALWEWDKSKRDAQDANIKTPHIMHLFSVHCKMLLNETTAVWVWVLSLRQ